MSGIREVHRRADKEPACMNDAEENDPVDESALVIEVHKNRRDQGRFRDWDCQSY